MCSLTKVTQHRQRQTPLEVLAPQVTAGGLLPVGEPGSFSVNVPRCLDMPERQDRTCR